MIELTATHKSIIERKKQGIPDSTIRKWCGLSESEYLDAVRHIDDWRNSGGEDRPPPPVYAALDGLKSAVYRELCAVPKWLLSVEIGQAIGLPTRETGEYLKQLKADGLAKNIKTTKGLHLWKAV